MPAHGVARERHADDRAAETIAGGLGVAPALQQSHLQPINQVARKGVTSMEHGPRLNGGASPAPSASYIFLDNLIPTRL